MPQCRAQTESRRSKNCVVSLQRDAKIFGRHFVSPIPLPFEPRALTRKHVGYGLHDFCHEGVCLFHGSTGFIDEAALEVRPPFPQAA